jgi:CBS domain-containing protein
MKVFHAMTRDPVHCTTDTNLAAVAELMWNADCGMVPVLRDGRVDGIITDRDICIAVTTRNIAPCLITAGQVIGGEVSRCAPEDDIKAALCTMRNARVRRLPVVDSSGALVGVLSITDLLDLARPGVGSSPELTYDEVLDALKAICNHRSHQAMAYVA